MKEHEILLELEEITSNFNFLQLLGVIARTDFCTRVENVGNRRGDELLTEREYAFLAGLWLKNGVKGKNDRNILEKRPRVYQLMENLHRSIVFNNEAGSSDWKANLNIDGRHFREAFFYGSSNAYSFQFARQAEKKYHLDEDWILKNKGFSLSSISPFFDHIQRLLNKRLNDYARTTPKGDPLKDDHVFEVFCLSANEVSTGNAEFQAILNAFTSVLEVGANQNLASIGDFNDFLAKPIIRVEEDKYFIPMPFCLAEACYETPFYWMLDDKNYLNQLSDNRGKVSESLVHGLFSQVYGKEHVFKGVVITKGKTTISDIDVLCLHKDTAFIIQLKSKRLSQVSQKGDLMTIRSDFKKAVEEPFNQGIKCREALEKYQEYNFKVDDPTDLKRQLSFVKEFLIICMTFDPYPAVTYSTQILLHENNAEETICLSSFDLETIFQILKSPAKVSDYLKRRIKGCKIWFAENELQILGFYLKNGLRPPGEGVKQIYLERHWGDVIDQELFVTPEIPALPKKTPTRTKPNKKKERRNGLCGCGSGAKFKNCHGKSAG